jgi:hypothetical protein
MMRTDGQMWLSGTKVEDRNSMGFFETKYSIMMMMMRADRQSCELCRAKWGESRRS